jgi:hypothetical protein
MFEKALKRKLPLLALAVNRRQQSLNQPWWKAEVGGPRTENLVITSSRNVKAPTKNIKLQRLAGDEQTLLDMWDTVKTLADLEKGPDLHWDRSPPRRSSHPGEAQMMALNVNTRGTKPLSTGKKPRWGHWMWSLAARAHSPGRSTDEDTAYDHSRPQAPHPERSTDEGTVCDHWRPEATHPEEAHMRAQPVNTCGTGPFNREKHSWGPCM